MVIPTFVLVIIGFFLIVIGLILEDQTRKKRFHSRWWEVSKFLQHFDIFFFLGAGLVGLVVFTLMLVFHFRFRLRRTFFPKIDYTLARSYDKEKK